LAGGVGSTAYLIDHNVDDVVPLRTKLRYVRNVQFVAKQRTILLVGSDGVEQWTHDGIYIHRWQPKRGNVICARQVGDELFVAWG
jgi:hypothetical protein